MITPWKAPKEWRPGKATTLYCEHCGAGATFLTGSITEREWLAEHGPYCPYAPKVHRVPPPREKYLP